MKLSYVPDSRRHLRKDAKLTCIEMPLRYPNVFLYVTTAQDVERLMGAFPQFAAPTG